MAPRRSSRVLKRKTSGPSDSPANKIQATGAAKRGRSATTPAESKENPCNATNLATNSKSKRSEPDTTRYKSGDYLIAKSDIVEYRSGNNPPIWRIDGKYLLQKFTPFDKNGKIQYKNIPTYSDWTPASYHKYTAVKTKLTFQDKNGTAVKLLDVVENAIEAIPPETQTAKQNSPWKNPLKARDYKIPDEMRLNENAFEIYIQALISNAVDSTFMKYLYDYNDTYFLPAINKIEDQPLTVRNKLLEVVKWSNEYIKAVDTWPCINLKNETNTSCGACNGPKAVKLVQFYGRPYNNELLEDVQADKGLKIRHPLCERCAVITYLYHKIRHFKYEHFDQCKIKVTNMRVLYPDEESKIVEELIDNREWVMTLFETMCQNTVRADKFCIAEKERLRRKVH